MRWIRVLPLVAAALSLALAAGPVPAQDARPDVETAVPDELAAGPGTASPTGPSDAFVAPDALAGDGSGAEPAAAGPSEGIERAWFAPATSLEERVARTRRASLEYGVWNLDAPARALVAGGVPGSPLDRARAAVRLAPDLPLARMELARVMWLHDDSPLAALRAAWGAALAIPRHPEASLWFAGAAAAALAAALVLGGLLCIAAAGCLAAPHAAHDLGDLISRSTPSFARVAVLGALLLLPLALGEGALGLALVLLALGCAYGARAQRWVLGLAAAAVAIGAFPVANLAGTLQGALDRDPVAEAAVSTALGSSLTSDSLRLAAAHGDPLAARALARRARRAGSLASADAHYQQLLEEGTRDWIALNNAGNVRLELGHLEAALDLYRRAGEGNPSAVVFYNLAQAYGRSFQVEELAATLEHAQALDADLMAELAQLQTGDAAGFVVDLPLPVAAIWQRLGGLEAGAPLAAELRARLAPGRLGRSVAVAAGACLGACLLGSLLGGRFRHSRWCGSCGRRQCTRCDDEPGSRSLCGACIRILHHPGETDKARRMERIEALRERQRRIERLVAGVALAVPGVAGFLAGRPLRSLVGCFFFALAIVALAWRGGPVPDPALAGLTAPFLALHLAAVCGLAYAIVVTTALATRRRL